MGGACAASSKGRIAIEEKVHAEARRFMGTEAPGAGSNDSRRASPIPLLSYMVKGLLAQPVLQSSRLRASAPPRELYFCQPANADQF
jgi:hypothetical protein